MTVLTMGLTCVKVMSPEQGELPKEAGLEFHFTRNRGRRTEPDSQDTSEHVLANGKLLTTA